MEKVLIVDDEYFAREGMKKTIDWKGLGCDLIGEAKDGYEGIQKAKEHMPDLIITDISMPGLNGLDMAKEIKKFNEDCKFIIITGYDDFNYAKESFKINAFDFILKPIDEDELEDSIKKVIEHIREDKYTFTVEREKFIRNLVKGKIKDEFQIDNYRQKYKIHMEKLCTIILETEYLEEFYETNHMEELNEQLEYIKREIFEKFEGIENYFIERNEKIILLVEIDSKDKILDICNRIKEIQKSFYHNFLLNITIGISNRGSLKDTRKLYKESKRALENKIYDGKGSINYYSKVKDVENKKLMPLFHKEEELKMHISSSNKEKIKKIIDKLYKIEFKNNHTAPTFIKSSTIHIVLLNFNLLKENHICPENVFDSKEDFFQLIEQRDTIEELYKISLNISIKTANLIKGGNNICNSNMSKVLKYIKDNYNKDISLSKVAKTVYLSESYLSRKIKEVTGKNFVEYITDLRIKKAMEYLSDENYTIADIAKELGYSDYRYFSKSFKKYTGISPREFRKQ
ncbi:response regulator [Anaeromicrobium sediminis]|uniref:Stage 0 sporulation protein A homolog n=1 Tax=Anaeromicrobium sediminis TaxID=1478221 RepID=A0A267MJ88_9FIRM|nr:response regulator [Anaeromicrobium sediminis]PAB59661.1 hypothetical protein CCE28_08830 [Anaeromicrobium sediminis]